MICDDSLISSSHISPDENNKSLQICLLNAYSNSHWLYNIRKKFNLLFLLHLVCKR